MMANRLTGSRIFIYAFIAALAFVIVFAGILPIFTDFFQRLYGPTPITPVVPTPVPTPGITYAKAFDIEFDLQELDAITGAANAGAGSSYKVFHSEGVPLAQRTTLYGYPVMLTLSTTATTVALYATDNYILYISAYTGTDDYPDPDGMLKAHPFLTSYKWIEVDKIGVNRLVFEMDVRKAGTVPQEPVQVTPAMRVMVTALLFVEDITPTSDSPADITGIGTTPNTIKYITWKITGIDTDQGSAFAKVFISSNQTTQYITAKKLWMGANKPIYLGVSKGVAVDEGAYYRWSAPVVVDKTAGVEQYWTYHPGLGVDKYQLANAIFVTNPSGSMGYTEIRLEVLCSFAAGASVTAVLNIEPIDSDNALATAITDSVTLSA